MRAKTIASIIAAAWTMGSTSVTAEPGTELDLSVPEAPAFAILDVAPENVTRPASPRELAASLLNGVDRDGNLQTGLALAVAPYQISPLGRSLTLNEYRDSNLQQALFRTDLSLATTKGATDDDESVRLAAGLRSVLWALGEGRQDKQLDSCLEKHVFAKWSFLQDDPASPTVLRKLAKLYNGGEDNVNGLDDILGKKVAAKELEEVKADLTREGIAAAEAEKFVRDIADTTDFPKAAADQCFAEARHRAWNAAGLETGAAFSMISEDGGVGDLHSNGGACWTSFSYGFQGLVPDDAVDTTTSFAGTLRRNFQLLAHARYRNSAVIVNDDGTSFDQDDLLLGGRLRIRPLNRFRDFALSAEVSYVHAMPDDGKDDDSVRYSGTAEIKVASNLWLQATAGTNEGEKDGDDAFVIGGIKFGFESESAFAARNPTP